MTNDQLRAAIVSILRAKAAEAITEAQEATKKAGRDEETTRDMGEFLQIRLDPVADMMEDELSDWLNDPFFS